MSERIKITIVGGGSYHWCPTLLNDILLKNGEHGIDFYLYDINLKAAKDIAEFGSYLNKKYGYDSHFIPTKDKDKAFKDTRMVVITITTGGLHSMEKDLRIPQEYGIFHTVGDTVGPGGWARALRNIPVFVNLAKDIEKRSQDAFILNYTNPMTILTKTLCVTSKLKVVGLCHGVFDTYDVFKNLFNVEEKDISVVSAGINHFFWILDFKIKGQSGYKLLKEKLGKKHLYDVLNDSHLYVATELYEKYGYLTYLADRHIVEFFNKYLTPKEDKLKEYNIIRTFVSDRKKKLVERIKFVKDILSGRKEFNQKASRETAAEILGVIINNKEFVDVMNVPNIGQIDNLPRGAVVETLGVINSLGFTPLSCGSLPKDIYELVIPHVLNKNLIVESSLEGNLDKAFKALYNDPLCSHLSLKQIKKMGEELLHAHKNLLPQFFKVR